MKIEKITPQIAALYLGVKCEYPDNEGSKTFATLTGVSSDGIETTFKRKRNGVCGDIIAWAQRSPTQKCFAGALVLHLRRLESITEEEALEIYTISRGVKWKELDWHTAKAWFLNSEDERLVSPIDMIIGDSDALLYLLSKHFDLFGLIEAGLAKEVKPETVTL